MTKTKIGSLEAIMLVLTIVISHSSLALPNDVLTNYHSASIINIIYVSIFALLLVLLIVRLFKKFPGMDIIDISEYAGGKILKNLIGVVFITYFIVSSGFILRIFCESIKIIYYPMTNITFLIALFVIAVCIANSLNFNATIKANKIILPFALISIIFIFITNMSNFVPQRIFPILGNGFFKTFLLGLSNIASFDGIVFLYFLPPLLKNPADFKKISIISTIITSIYLIFTIATLLLVFSLFTKIHQISPLYNASRYIEFGTFFQRLESIFLLIWIMVFASYLSITLKFSTYIFQKITLLTDTKILIPVLGLLLFGIALLPNNLAISQYYETHIYPILMLGISIFLSLSILIFANIFKKGVNFKK